MAPLDPCISVLDRNDLIGQNNGRGALPEEKYLEMGCPKGYTLSEAKSILFGNSGQRKVKIW